MIIIPLARVSGKGQITLPAAARGNLGIKPHSSVEIITGEREITIRPTRSIRELSGIFRDRIPPGPPFGRQEERRTMEEAVAREVANE